MLADLIAPLDWENKENFLICNYLKKTKEESLLKWDVYFVRVGF
jgi:hypothetical protein